jgi:hypothetical protein
VEAVSAWHYPTTFGWQEAGLAVDFEGIAHQILSEAITAVDGLEPGVAVLSQVTEGFPAEVLLHAHCPVLVLREPPAESGTDRT